MITRIVLAAALLIPAFSAWSDPLSTPAIDQRQANQQQRINQGVQSGQLTPAEAAKLKRDQARIQKMENKAKADGVVTPKERQRIRHAQDIESRKIAKEKHDRQQR